MADTHAGRRWLVAIPALTGCDRGADEKENGAGSHLGTVQ